MEPVTPMTPRESSTALAEPPLPDAEGRASIVRELGTDILVEAGAGSGKTTELVRRMVALVRTGTARVEEIAAVTFTRKAASELRERFQEQLEGELARARDPGGPGGPGGPGAAREALETALREVDRAFIGTIHAFCARLLRERPLEAGLDPGFEETLEDEEYRRSRRFWNIWLERLAARGDELLADLDRVGLRPSQLSDLYGAMQQYTDVRFDLEDAPPPDPGEVAAVREALDDLVRRGLELMPDERIEGRRDALQERLLSLRYRKRMTGWEPDTVLYEALEELCRVSEHKITQKLWSDGKKGKKRAKAFRDEVNDFTREGGRADRLLRAWWAHRYPVAVRFARAAATAYAEHRAREGWLNFQDLLVHTAALLRRDPGAREDLGLRYRRILVDEFQDTDPLQAEILFLLASPPGEDDDWRELEPRPGQLFVVGDPKQSIYRFRRADIGIYEAVRERFDEDTGFGRVVKLVSNFRSRPEIGRLVNDVFDDPDAFPEDPTERQAAFAPMHTRPREEAPPAEGVFFYEIEEKGSRHDPVVREDAERLASWIRRRTSGPAADRTPGDFLVLAWNTFHLHSYARALEARNLPVQVSGAGVSAEDELTELLILLRALVDPDDEVGLLACLTGLFFGLDAETLVRHRLDGGRFDLRSPGEEGEPGVLKALELLRGWWLRSRSEPADVLVGSVVETLGLVPHAAADELGQVRAGALLYGLEAVRATALAGDTSLAGAVDALEGVVEAKEAEAPLEPGRDDVVRVMNLHKAKGLEAPVVVLACPLKAPDHPPSLHVERTGVKGADAGGRGWLVARERERFTSHVLACPLEWPELEAEETLYGRAEEVRLRYVAATRARDELVVARRPEKDDDSPWRLFHPWLEEHGTRLDLPEEPRPPRERLEATGEEMRDRVASVEAERQRRAVPTYRFVTVTERAKKGEETPGDPGGEPDQIDLFATPAPRPAVQESTHPDDGPLHRGPDWGSAVHAVLEVAARGAGGDVLRSVARAHLLEYQRPVDGEGEPVELPALLETVGAVLESELWLRARRAERRMAEVAFAVPLDDGDVPTVLDGQVDLAFREEEGWVLVDYKTDLDPPPSRVAAYGRQLRAYAEAWESGTGDPVTERLLFFTRTGEARSL